MTKVLRTCGAILLLAMASQAAADLYGYVDEKGVAHLSRVPLHEGYYLFKKEPPEPLPEEPRAVIPVFPVPAAARDTRINPAHRKHYGPLVTAVAREHKLDVALLHAVITVESGYNPKARSSKGAMGLMQLMPETARRYAVKNIWDPRDNLNGGAQYLRDLLVMFNNNLSLALAAYNAGEAAVVQAGNEIPPFAETRSYVPRVLAHYDSYRVLGTWPKAISKF